MRAPLRTLMRPVTLLILPSDAGRSYRIRMPLVVWLAGLGLGVASLAVAAVLSGRHLHYEAMRLLNAHLAEENRLYAVEVARAEQLTRRLTPLEHDLRRMLGRKRAVAQEGGGVGGPEVMYLPEEIPQRVDRLAEVGSELFREYQGLASLAASTPSGWPLRGWITSEFGERVSPYTGEVGSLHTGIDIANKLGSPIVATADGTVLRAGWTSGGYGKLVEIGHGYGYSTLYGHCSRLKVAVGQHVRQGEVIAYVGSTGAATGPHCHYEVRLYGVPIHPGPFMR